MSKISKYPPATFAADADIAVIVQGGATKRVPLSVMKTYFAGSPIQNKLDGSGAPGVGDDSEDGYSVGSIWIDVAGSPKEAYRCVDATAGAAIWLNTTLEISELGTAALADIEDFMTTVAPAAAGDILMAEGSPLAWVKKTTAEAKAALAIVAAASSAEINSGTEAAKYISPDALAGSRAGMRPFEVMCVGPTTDVAIADGVGFFIVPDEMDGMHLVRIAATVITAGTTNSTGVQVYNLTKTANMLSVAMGIETGETSTRTSDTPGTIDPAHNAVVTGDVLRFDVVGVSSTAPKGLIIDGAFQLP